MAVIKKDDWKMWNEERERFQKRDTEGFTQDLKALTIHILKLQDLAPKDKANWPVGQALRVIDGLQSQQRVFTTWLEQLR